MIAGEPMRTQQPKRDCRVIIEPRRLCSTPGGQGLAEPCVSKHTGRLVRVVEVSVHRMSLLASALLILSFAAPAVAQHPDFSGMWTLDADASDFTAPAFSGGRGGDDTGRLFITHAANGTVVIGAETNGMKAWSFTPGKELTIAVGRDTTMRAASRWEGEQ